MMHTGPVGRFPRYPSEDGGDLNHSIQARTGDTFAWATVVTPDPLSIVFDGQTAPVPGTPSTLVSETALLPYTRVWVQRHSADDGHTAARQNIVLGLTGGGNPWVDVEILDEFAKRESTANNDFQPQVLLDGSGLVDFRGQMGPDGFVGAGLVGADTPILQLPDGYWPEAEVRWIGFPTDNLVATMGGWFSSTNGRMYIKANSPSPSTHWCIIVQPWKPVPAQPY